VFLCMDVPVVDLVVTITHLGGTIFQKPYFGGVNRHFQGKMVR